MRWALIIAIIVPLAATGCQYPFEFRTQEEIRDEVLDRDPLFASLLDKKSGIDEKIKGLREEISIKKGEINSKVLVLKQELNVFRQQTDSRIKELDAQLSPYREELKQKIQELVIELKLKESSASAANKMALKLEKIVEQGSTSESLAKEAPKWQNKITSLRSQIQELETELASIRQKINLIRLKLRLLK